jgi:hypothetical protein
MNLIEFLREREQWCRDAFEASVPPSPILSERADKFAAAAAALEKAEELAGAADRVADSHHRELLVAIAAFHAAMEGKVDG